MLKRRRILFVAPSAYRLGGLATWLDYLLPGLESRGWEPVLGLVSGPRYHRPDPYLAEHPWHRVTTLPCADGTPYARERCVRKVVARWQPTIVVTVNVPHAIRGASACRPRPCIVMTCHGILPTLFEDMRRLSAYFDAVVVTNRLAQKLAVTTAGLDVSRVRYASYGTACPDALSFLSNKSSGDLFTLAYVGRIEQSQKRVMDVARILEELTKRKQRVRLIIAGDGPQADEFRKALERASDAYHHIEWLGHVAASDLPAQVWSRADAMILTSSWETGPIVVWEAMAHGVVVVTSRYTGSGLEGALEDGRNCLQFDIGDSEGAAEAVCRMAKNSALRRELAEAAFQLVRDRYSQEASVDLWDKVLCGIVQLPKTAKPDTQVEHQLASGRLDGWFPPWMACAVRRALRRKPPDTGPAGEWPFTLSGVSEDSPGFWDKARALDCRRNCGPGVLAERNR